MNTTQEAPAQTGQPVYKISDADKARQKRIQEAWEAYDGELEPPLEPMPDGRDPNVRTNRISPAIERMADFLFGDELGITVGQNDPQEAQDFLDLVWGDKEERLPLLQELCMNGSMAGQAFLRIVPNQTGDKFELVAIDPSTVFVKTAPQNCKKVLLYCIQYCEDDKQNGQDVKVHYHEEIVRIGPDGKPSTGDTGDTDTWSIQHWTMITSAGQDPEQGTWTPAGEPIPWPYPFPPMDGCPNLIRPNSPWGKPDSTKDLIAVNEALNFVQSNINSVNMIYGAPILYSNGMGQGIMEIPVGRIIGTGHPDAKISSVPIASDQANALSFSGNLRRAMDELTGVPGIATGDTSEMAKGNISGIALETFFMPLIKSTKRKRCTYGKLIIDTSKRLLILNRMSPDIKITLSWQNPLPQDDLPAIQGALAKKQLGISNRTLQEELGYDPDEEARRSQEEDAQALVNFSKGQGFPPMPPNQQPGQQPPGQGVQTQETKQ